MSQIHEGHACVVYKINSKTSEYLCICGARVMVRLKVTRAVEDTPCFHRFGSNECLNQDLDHIRTQHDDDDWGDEDARD